jgi:hypothetical protein
MDCANFARVENHAGILFEGSGRDRAARAYRAATRGVPTIALRLMFVVICGHSRRFVAVFAHEIPGACKFGCYLQGAVLECARDCSQPKSITTVICKIIVSSMAVRSPDEATTAFTPVFDGLWRNPGPTAPHSAEFMIGRRFAPTRWLHAGYKPARRCAFVEMAGTKAGHDNKASGCTNPVRSHPERHRRAVLVLEVAVARQRPEREEFRVAVVAQVEHAREAGRGVARLVPEAVGGLVA